MQLRRYSWCLLLLTPLSAQEQPEVSAHTAPATFSSKVNLVSVPVVVRDAQGRAVGSLRREDFQLSDKGKVQSISRFTVERSSAAPVVTSAPAAARVTPELAGVAAPARPPQIPDRYAAYLFDDIHLEFAQLAQVRNAAKKHFAESLTPSRRAAIFTTSGRVSQDFTADPEKLNEALDQLSVGPNAKPLAGSDCPPTISDYQADLIVNKQDGQSFAAAAQEVSRCFPGMDPRAMVMALSNQALSANHIDTTGALTLLAGVVQRLSVMPGNRSIVLASPGFMVLTENHAQETELMDRAIHANVVINTLDACGLYTPLMGEAASNRNSVGNSLSMRYKRESADAQKDVMYELADGTGGKAFVNDNGFKEGFDALAATPEFTYILGFSPQNLKPDGAYHTLKVALINSKGLQVQARRGYWAPNHAVNEAEQAKEEIRESVFSLDELHDIPIDIATDFFKLSDVSAELNVESKLDLKPLKFRAEADRNADTLTVVTGLFDQDGHYVKGVQRVIELRLRQQTLSRLLTSGLTVKETFDLAPGRYVIRVVARDSQGQTMAARNGTVEIK